MTMAKCGRWNRTSEDAFAEIVRIRVWNRVYQVAEFKALFVRIWYLIYGTTDEMTCVYNRLQAGLICEVG